MKFTSLIIIAFMPIGCNSCYNRNDIPSTSTQDLNPKVSERKKGSRDSVRFAATNVSGEYIVKIGGKPMGIHKRQRSQSKMCGHLNSTQTWLVVEDGCGGDSYPKITAYELTKVEMRKSFEMERIDKEHYFKYSQGGGMTDPVFLGFDPSGAPIISSATGMHTLQDSPFSFGTNH